MIVVTSNSSWGDSLEQTRQDRLRSYNSYYQALKSNPNLTDQEKEKLKSSIILPAQKKAYQERKNWVDTTMGKYQSVPSSAEGSETEPLGVSEDQNQKANSKGVYRKNSLKAQRTSHKKSAVVLDGADVPREIVYGRSPAQEEKKSYQEDEVSDDYIPASVEFGQ